MKKKKFDCVIMMRKIRKDLSNELYGLSFKERQKVLKKYPEN